MTNPLLTAPWTRAFRLIWRHPAVVAGVVGGSAVLGAAAAAPALFVSSAANAAQATQVDGRCAGTIGPTIDQAADAAPFDAAVRRAAAGEPALGAPIATFSSIATGVTDDGNAPSRVTLLSRTGQLDHITRLQGGGPAGGAWVTQQTARQLGLHPGSTMHFRATDATVPVTGIYRDVRPYLLAHPFDPYWCAPAQLIVPRGDYEDAPPPAILLDQSTFRRLALATGTRTDGPGLGGTWELPARLRQASDGSRLTRFYDRFPDRIEAGLTAAHVPHDSLEEVRSALPFVDGRTTTLAANVRNAIEPVGIAGIVTALLLVGAAGAYWVDRRRDEVTMLAVRGVGPGAIGSKALIESLLASMLGAAGGFAIAVALVKGIGPSSVLDGASVADAARRVALSLLIGLVLLGAVAGIRSRSLGSRHTRRARLPVAWLPWEAVPLLLAWWSHRRLEEMGSPVAQGTDLPHVDLLALAFPLLFIVGTVALAARLATATLRLLRDRGQRWPTWVFLAGRRLGATSHLAVILLAASATAVGVFVYAGTLTHTLDITLDAKAQTARGSDVVLETVGPPKVPAAFRDRSTVVRTLIDTQLSLPQVDVLAVDPATFARGVLWDSSFADQSLDHLLTQLDRPTTSGGVPGRAEGVPGRAEGVPAIVINGPLPPGNRLDFVDPRYPDLKIDPVAGAKVFPGVSRTRPMVVVTTSAIAKLPNRPVQQVWIEGGSDGVAPAFTRAGNQIRFLTTTEGVLDQTSFLTVAWTFGFMQALGVLVALITVGGMLLYLDTRQRSRRVSYAFLRRMGLSRRAHRRSIIAEVGVVLVGGTLLGAALACAAAAFVYLDVDPVPRLLPAPLLRFPSGLLLGVVAASFVVAWFGGRVAQLSADRGDVAEVLRAEV
jgi:putative ABC transport system permease protein